MSDCEEIFLGWNNRTDGTEHWDDGWVDRELGLRFQKMMTEAVRAASEGKRVEVFFMDDRPENREAVANRRPSMGRLV